MILSPTTSKISFKRALRKEEVRDYTETLNNAKAIAGQTGKSILIVHDACLPQRPELNTGIGNLAANDSLKFFETMKTYLGINTVEILPQGPIKPKKGLYCAYSSSALPLGNHVISPELLMSKEFENLITNNELAIVVKSNSIPDKESRVNYPNVMDNDSPFDKLLKKAFERFKKLDENNHLKQEFAGYISENNDWMEPLAKQEKNTDPAFFKFKQFLADMHLKIAKEKLNNLGLKLCVDCEIGFSPQEVSAFPGAFKKDTYIGVPSWELPALDYDTILNPESASYNLLKKKVQLNAKRGDTIRFDVSWAYITPKLTPIGGQSEKKEMGDSLIKLIESWVQEVKGKDFDLKNLLHEFEAGPDDFRAMINDRELIPPLKGRTKVYSSTYMSNDWGTNDAFINYRGFSPDEYVLGVGNHDPQPLRQIANGLPDKVIENGVQTEKYYKPQQIEPLSRILKIPREVLDNPIEFAKAKFAEAMMAKNNMVFYMDVFGRGDRFDMQDFNNPMAYSHKIPADYEKAYIKAVQEGYGFNPMDSLEKIFKAKGLDITQPALYKKILKYRDILIEENSSKIKNSFTGIKMYAVLVTLAFAAVCTAFYIKSKKKVTPKNEPAAQNPKPPQQTPAVFSNFHITN